VALTADEADSEAARRHSAEAGAALIAVAEAEDSKLGQFLRPDPADPRSVTWTVTCYQIGDLSPSALRDFSDGFAAVQTLARCPDATHVAAELIASTPAGLHWTAMVRTGELVRFQLPGPATASDSGTPGQHNLAAAQRRWAEQSVRWAIEPDEPDGLVGPFPNPDQPTPSVPGGVDVAVILGQILEAVRGLGERLDSLERRLTSVPPQFGGTNVPIARPDNAPCHD
jgi:hypothetical protein